MSEAANRRGFITGTASLLMAPALVRASSLDFVPRGAGLYDVTFNASGSMIVAWDYIMIYEDYPKGGHIATMKMSPDPQISGCRETVLTFAPDGIFRIS